MTTQAHQHICVSFVERKNVCKNQVNIPTDTYKNFFHDFYYHLLTDYLSHYKLGSQDPELAQNYSVLQLEVNLLFRRSQYMVFTKLVVNPTCYPMQIKKW